MKQQQHNNKIQREQNILMHHTKWNIQKCDVMSRLCHVMF